MTSVLDRYPNLRHAYVREPIVFAALRTADERGDEACPCCDGNGWLETAEGHQIACELCDERGLVAIDATYHAHEEAYESLDAAIAAACEVAS